MFAGFFGGARTPHPAPFADLRSTFGARSRHSDERGTG
jgi:hypothetical protein